MIITKNRMYRFKLDPRNNILTEAEPYIQAKDGKRCRVVGPGKEGWDWQVCFGNHWMATFFVMANELQKYEKRKGVKEKSIRRRLI